LQVSASVDKSFPSPAPPQRFNQTMRMLMSAGDTPEIRAA